jgi:hypothetical protein
MSGEWVSLTLALVASLGLGGCAVDAGSETEPIDVENVGEHAEALVGNVYTPGESASDVRADKDVVVTCPTGKYVYGMGYRTVYTSGAAAGTATDATLRHSAPSADGRSWRVKVRKAQGLTDWKLWVSVTCAPKVAGYEIKVTEAPLETGHSVVNSTACGPISRVPTIRAVGGGYGLYDAAGLVAESSVRSMQAGLASWTATMHNPTGATATAKTFAICVPNTSVQEHTAVVTPQAWGSSSTGPVSITAFCPAGGLALSAGFQLLDQNGNDIFPTVHESRFLPNSLGSSYGWRTVASRLGAPSKQVPTTLKQSLLCVKDLPN